MAHDAFRIRAPEVPHIRGALSIERGYRMTTNFLSKLNPATWAAVSLAVLTAAIGAITIASAGGVSPDSCHSATACSTFSNTGKGSGIISKSSKGNGLVAISNDSAPVSYQVGALWGDATSGTGENGAYAFAEGRNGGFFENANASFYTLFGYADASGAFPLGVQNAADGGLMYVDSVGNGFFSGSVTATSFNVGLRTRDGRTVSSYASQSASAELSDSGTAQLVGGRGVVRLDPSFGRTLDMRAGYRVFLTPMGDSRGLYVASKSPTSFEVRESQGGRSTLSFDYRIVGSPVGASAARLPALNIGKPFVKGAPGHVPTK